MSALVCINMVVTTLLAAGLPEFLSLWRKQYCSRAAKIRGSKTVSRPMSKFLRRRRQSQRKQQGRSGLLTARQHAVPRHRRQMMRRGRGSPSPSSLVAAQALRMGRGRALLTSGEVAPRRRRALCLKGCTAALGRQISSQHSH